MFCPQCGSTQSADLRFCKSCGANLEAVRVAVAKPDRAAGNFDWSKTWVAEMLQGSEESVRRAAELERLQGITPETKRRKEIKAGVITASAGVSLMIVLAVIMQGIIFSGSVTDAAAQILARIWIVGLIPIFVGLALIVNGLFVSKKGDPRPAQLPGPGERSDPNALRAAAVNNLHTGAPFSVIDETTRHLEKVPAGGPTAEFPDPK